MISARAPLNDQAAWERERLVLAVGALLSPPARTLPTVVVIEDLHWADPFTLDLLTYLVAGTATGATFVVTLRADERPMPPAVLSTVAELQRLDETVLIKLEPLPVDVVARQAEDILGHAAPPGLVAALVKVGGGNPFFTDQLCRQVAGTDHELSVAPPWVLPPQLSGFLQSRIRGLSESARRSLLLLGVAGSPLSASGLATAADLPDKDIARVVQELSDKALLAPGDQAHLAPRHALLATAVAEAADPVTMAWAHVSIASLLDSSTDPLDAIASASHWAAAGRDREELRVTLRAAPVAEGLADFAMAAELRLRAHTLTQTLHDQAAAEGQSALQVAVSAVEALNRAGRTDEAHRLAEDAFALLSPVEETLLGGTLRWC